MENPLHFLNYWLGKLYIKNPYVPADKQMHLIGGIILGIIFSLVMGLYAILPVAIIAYLKELYDYKNSTIHTPDFWDWFATALGGVIGSLIVVLV